MDWRAKVELFEQIRREYEFGIGTIVGVAKKLSVHRRMVREAIGSAVPKPRKRPEVMVIPERETPGQSARACAVPMVTASPMLDCSMGLVMRDLESAHHMIRATMISEMAMT